MKLKEGSAESGSFPTEQLHLQGSIRSGGWGYTYLETSVLSLFPGPPTPDDFCSWPLQRWFRWPESFLLFPLFLLLTHH